jgi:hypothetical protein
MSQVFSSSNNYHQSQASRYSSEEELTNILPSREGVNPLLVNKIIETAGHFTQAFDNVYNIVQLVKTDKDNMFYSRFMNDMKEEINSFIITGGKSKRKTIRKKSKRISKNK